MVKKVLVAPLDWGLGHATRSIPVILELQRQGANVVMATSGEAWSLLKLEFPELSMLELPSYQVKYPLSGSLAVSMLRQLPKFRKAIREENRLLNKYVADLKIDAVISDNRFGCWTSTARSIFITHQSNPIMPPGFSWMSAWVRS